MNIKARINVILIFLLIFVVLLLFLSFQVNGIEFRYKQQSQSDTYSITLIAKSWNWVVIMPNGTTSNSSLYVYANVTYTFNVYTVDNGTDVILDGHGLAIGPTEILPNILKDTIYTFQYTFTSLGLETLRCTTFCGAGHNAMKIDIFVEELPAQSNSSPSLTTTEIITTTEAVGTLSITTTTTTTTTTGQNQTITEPTTLTSTQKLDYPTWSFVLSLFLLIFILKRRKNP